MKGSKERSSAVERARQWGMDLSLVEVLPVEDIAGRVTAATRNYAQVQKLGGRSVEIDIDRLVRTLSEAGVEFIIIGGAAAVAQGSSFLTADLDVCYRRSPENIRRLVSALAPLHPRLRVAGMPDEEARKLPFQWDEDAVLRGFHFTLMTDAGPLDLIGEVVGIGDYEKVRAYAEEKNWSGQVVYVLTLEGLIVSKRALGRPKDLLQLQELEALQELRKSSGGDVESKRHDAG